MPKTITPIVVIAAIMTGTRPDAASERQASGSTMLSAAVTMSAPRSGVGRYSIGAVRNTSTIATSTTDTNPAT